MEEEEEEEGQGEGGEKEGEKGEEEDNRPVAPLGVRCVELQSDSCDSAAYGSVECGGETLGSITGSHPH